MSLPNALTILRILLTLLVMRAVFMPGVAAKSLALVFFLVASMTDWLDGYLARRWNIITPLGILLDPIADKILVIGLFLTFVRLGLIPGWMVAVIVLREALVTAARMAAARRRVIIAAAKEGKQKMVSQLATIFAVLVRLLAQDVYGAGLDWRAILWMDHGILACMSLTVSFTVYSGARFFWRNRAVLAASGCHDAGVPRG